MTSNTGEGTLVPFTEATKMERLDSHSCKVNLDDAFCIGAVPNGGYTASCMLAAAHMHLSSRNQPDALTHISIPNPNHGWACNSCHRGRKTEKRATILTPSDPLARRSPPPRAILHPSVSRRTVLAYTTHTDLHTFSGITLPTGFSVTSTELPAPLPKFERLKTQDAEDSWERSVPPKGSEIVRSLNNWGFYMPRGDPLVPGVLDMWIRRSSGEFITQSALPYVVDLFLYNIYTFLLAPELRKLLEAPQNNEEKTRKVEAQEQRASMWFPTVVMNMEVKMPLPKEGVEWLAVRVTSKQIKDGRFDLDVMVRDVEGDIVALSHHVAMILSIERNTGGKPKASL